MKLEEINCPICASKDFDLLLKAKDYRLRFFEDIFNIVKCRNCEFIFLNPRPSQDEFLNFYPTDFHKNDTSLLYKIIEPCFTISLKNTIRTLKRYKKQGKILDIGCGNGSFILAMQKHGYDVWGVELNPEAQKYTPLNFKGRIFFQELKECKFPEKSFDIITMFQSLEHVADLGTLFTEIRRIIKDKGIFYICVPNADFFESRLFGSYYYNLEVPRHFYFFTCKTLGNLLTRNGFNAFRVVRDNIFESVLTPASFYHGLWNFLSDKNILRNRILKYLSFLPLVIVRLFLRLFFIFDSQNLKIIFQRSC